MTGLPLAGSVYDEQPVMSDRLETAPSGRAQCRACGEKIDKGALRFGEELPSAYGDGDGTSVYWFHPRCAAHRRPDKWVALARAGAPAGAPPGAAELLASLLPEAELGIAHEKLPRLAGAEQAASGRARCRQCRQPIAGGSWRLSLSQFEDSGFFQPLGFLHPGCAHGYFGISDVSVLGPRVRQASPRLPPRLPPQAGGPAWGPRLDDATLGAILSSDPGAGPAPPTTE
jgi:hypothetical protein